MRTVGSWARKIYFFLAADTEGLTSGNLVCWGTAVAGLGLPRAEAAQTRHGTNLLGLRLQCTTKDIFQPEALAPFW